MSDKNKEDKKAIALQYDSEHDDAPKVIAKGSGFIAQEIIKIARENDIEIHQDSNLVEILSTLEIDSIIPLEAYAAVAEILSFIYKNNEKQKTMKANI